MYFLNLIYALKDIFKLVIIELKNTFLTSILTKKKKKLIVGKLNKTLCMYY